MLGRRSRQELAFDGDRKLYVSMRDAGVARYQRFVASTTDVIACTPLPALRSAMALPKASLATTSSSSTTKASFSDEWMRQFWFAK